MKFSVLSLFIGLLSFYGCHRNVENVPVKRYELHGKIVRLDPQNHTAVINGEKIPGWMEAMTMDYPVKVQSDYQRLHPGEQIQATVYVQGLNYWIGNIHPEAPPTK